MTLFLSHQSTMASAGRKYILNTVYILCIEVLNHESVFHGNLSADLKLSFSLIELKN